MTLKLGLTLPQRAALFGATSVGELLDLAAEADADERFTSLWVGDSLLAKPRPDSISLLGALAAATERVTLGVGCMASFPVRDPLTLAYQWATLDWLSGGRMLLAVCTGIVRRGLSAHEGAQWGVRDKDRAGRMADRIELLRELWSGDRISRQGPGYSYEDVAIEPLPVQQPCPVWIASNPPVTAAERPLRRVAQAADGWMSAELRRGEFGELWEMLRPFLVAEGRDPDSFPTIAYHNVHIDEDAGRGLAESQRFLTEYYGPVFGDDAVAAWTAHGGPAEVAASLDRLHREGAKEITVRFTSWDQRGQWERFTTEVIPLLDAGRARG